MKLRRLPIAAALFLAASVLSGASSAATIFWNTWTTAETGSLVVDGQTVPITFSTDNYHTNVANYPSWQPSSTFSDGTIIGNGPVASNGIMQLIGGTGAINTLTFASPVVDPVISIWSLGQGGQAASFVFSNATPVSIVGGPNAEYGGSALTFSGNTVTGNEGNGTVRFVGTYTSISWTNPQAENWYGFNVGVVSLPVPEPSTTGLMLAGLMALGALGWSTRRTEIR